MLFKSKSVWCCAVMLAFGLLTGACDNDSPRVEPTPTPTPTPKPTPPANVPTTIADCVPADIEALRAIGKANPQAHLFEGDDPSHWKTLQPKWVKNEQGKYFVSALSADGKDEAVAGLILHLDGAAKEGGIRLAGLQQIDITAPVKEVLILSQPALKSLRIHGAGKAKVTKVNVQGGKVLKEITIESMPELTTVMLGGDALDKVTLADLPKLKDQSNLKFRAGYDDAGNPVEDTNLKELVLTGNLSRLDGLYLPGMRLEKLTLNTTLPQLNALTLNSNHIAGTFEVKDMPKLTMLNVANNRLTTLKVSACPKLEELDASENKELTACNLSLPALKVLDLNETALTALDLSGFPNLKKASAYTAKLTSVTLGGKYTQLNRLNFAENQLTALHFPKEAATLSLLTLNKNALKALDITLLSKLERLQADDNQLEDLKVAGAVDLEELECANNHLSAKLLQQVKNELGGLKKWKIAPQLLVGRADKAKKQIRATEELAALKLALKVQKKDGEQWVDAPGTEFRLAEGVYTFLGKGTYRVIYSGSILPEKYSNFNAFSLSKPYVVGELAL